MRRTRADCVAGVLSASHLEEPPDDACAGTDAGRGVRKTGDDPNGDAATHAAGKGRTGITQPDSDHTSLPTAAAD